MLSTKKYNRKNKTNKEMVFKTSEFENRELPAQIKTLKGLLRTLALAIDERSKEKEEREKEVIHLIYSFAIERIKEEINLIHKKPVGAWVIIKVLPFFNYEIKDIYVRYEDARKSKTLSEENNIILPGAVLYNLREELEELRTY